MADVCENRFCLYWRDGCCVLDPLTRRILGDTEICAKYCAGYGTKERAEPFSHRTPNDD